MLQDPSLLRHNWLEHQSYTRLRKSVLEGAALAQTSGMCLQPFRSIGLSFDYPRRKYATEISHEKASQTLESECVTY